MPDRTKTALTPAQQDELCALRVCGALSRETAVDIYALQRACGGNANVIGILRDKKLAASRPRRASGRAWTDYWLTPEGLAKANELIIRRQPEPDYRSRGQRRQAAEAADVGSGTQRRAASAGGQGQ